MKIKLFTNQKREIIIELRDGEKIIDATKHPYPKFNIQDECEFRKENPGDDCLCTFPDGKKKGYNIVDETGKFRHTEAAYCSWKDMIECEFPEWGLDFGSCGCPRLSDACGIVGLVVTK